MDETRTAILNDSRRIISKLQLLAVFFGDEIIYKIYLRSQIIHQLFENNPELDINKLELFHLQFTQTLVELLRKIKRNNEQSISLLLEEMQINKDLIDQLQSSGLSRQTFQLEQQRQALKVNNSLRKLYEALSNDSAEYPFAKNINGFSARFAADFYREVPPEAMVEWMKYAPNEIYQNAYAVIQRKLMGTLCKYEFRTSFYEGVRYGDTVAEIYQLSGTDRFFIFFLAQGLFLFFDIDKLNNLENNSGASQKENLIQELNNKNTQLQNSINLVKSTLSPEIKQLLIENHKKLNDMNFLQSIADVDAQANILKAMLNTDII
ncbi:hypothetical protein GCM10027037_29270 [Mucilaginibacter koreensis]